MVGFCSSDFNVATNQYLKVKNNQSTVLVDNDGAHISLLCEDQILMSNLFDGVDTLYDCFRRGLSLAGDKPCLGWKPTPNDKYKWITYKETDARAKAFGAGLIHLGLSQVNSVRVGIYSKNRPEYIIADQAFFHHSLTGVPLYDTLGADACTFIINQSQLPLIICDSNEKVAALLDRRAHCPVMQTLIIIEQLSEENKVQADKNAVKIFQFDEVEKLGREHTLHSKPPKKSDLSMICYTSGTTGTPKGAMLTHENIVATASAGLRVLLSSGFDVTYNDCLISYLPLAHSYERIIEAVMLLCGAHIGFFQGDIKKLMDDIKELRPTIFPSVPRLLNRFYDKVTTGVNSSKIKKYLFNKAMKSKTKQLEKGKLGKNSIWDKVLFRKVQNALGGRIRVITTGSAPISPNVLTFLRCIVGCPIVEGYGQTENAGICSVTVMGDFKPGHVGPPFPCNLIKLIDVPEMDYFSSSNKGEVCLKGPNVFIGYLNEEQKTNEALDLNGWLHTGDIGEWLPNGTLKIIDRKKNIFKLAHGEYIAPEKIENILVQSPWVTQVYVHGDSLQAYLLAIVVPDPDTISGLASKHKIDLPIDQLYNNSEVKRIILTDLAAVGKTNGLSSLETVKDIKLHKDPFTIENGLLTPTFKMKRYQLAKIFAADFQKMYSSSVET